MDGKACLFRKEFIQAPQQSASACQHHTALYKVRGKFRRCTLEGYPYRLDYGGDRLGKSLPHFLGRDRDGLRKAGDQIAPAGLKRHLRSEERRGGEEGRSRGA